MSIDFQGLLNVVRAGEMEPSFSMKDWRECNDCGTTNCLIGAFCRSYPGDRLRIVELDDGVRVPSLIDEPSLSPIQAVATRFGLSVEDAQFLFENDGNGDPAVDLSKDEALGRLRGFIEMKMQSAEHQTVELSAEPEMVTA